MHNQSCRTHLIFSVIGGDQPETSSRSPGVKFSGGIPSYPADDISNIILLHSRRGSATRSRSEAVGHQCCCAWSEAEKPNDACWNQSKEYTGTIFCLYNITRGLVIRSWDIQIDKNLRKYVLVSIHNQSYISSYMIPVLTQIIVFIFFRMDQITLVHTGM